MRELQDELAALRAVAARPVVTVQALVEAPFLGEAVPLVVTVVDADGEPAVDAPVDLVATWGRLRASDGYSVDEGAALTVRMDIFGRAAATLTPPTSEDLQDVQQAALETSLATLDHSAPTPAEALDGLRELARQYRWEAASDLRHAVDVYFRDFRPRLLDTVNFRDYLARWSYLDSTVTASAVTTTSVDAVATLTVRFTDWLGAWLETYLALVEEDSDLRGRLSNEAGRTDNAGEILEGVHRRVGEFIESQRGVAGAYAAERIAEKSMLGFLDREVPKLPLQSRLELFPALTVPVEDGREGRRHRLRRDRAGAYRRPHGAAAEDPGRQPRRPLRRDTRRAFCRVRGRAGGEARGARGAGRGATRGQAGHVRLQHAANAGHQHREPFPAVKASETLELQEQAQFQKQAKLQKQSGREFDAPEAGTNIVTPVGAPPERVYRLRVPVRARHRWDRRGDRDRRRTRRRSRRRSLA